MPDRVKKAGSWFILSTYVTSLAIAVSIFGAGILKNSYDDNKELESLQSVSENIQSQMGELFQFHYETKLKVMEHDILMIDCRKNIEKCQERVLELHRRAQ